MVSKIPVPHTISVIGRSLIRTFLAGATKNAAASEEY